MKTCAHCGESKPIVDFAVRKASRDGRNSACKPCRNRHLAQWVKENPANMRAAKRRWNAANTKKNSAQNRQWREKNPEKNATRLREWKRENRPRVASTIAKRKAARLQRTPPWLGQAYLAEIEGIYHFAKVMEQITGQKYHVDHIEPLQSGEVSGLHVPWNLRAIPARDNVVKGNRRIIEHG